MYQKYIKNTKNGGFYACSSKCAKEKIKQTSLDKFGAEHYTQTDEYKDRYRTTCLEKYGVEHHTQNIDVKNKAIGTNLKKYGVDNPSKSPLIKEKIKNTFIERYGVDNISKLDSIKDKLSKNSVKCFKDNYDIDIIKYLNNDYYIKCDICDEIYNIHKKTLRNRLNANITPCTICNPLHNNISCIEKELSNFIKENYNCEIITNTKSIINPYELDIYLPDLNLAFEFNGVYWHNELNKPNDYHLMETNLCLDNNIQLVHIYEDDWTYKKDIIKSMILNKLNTIPYRIFGRKCIVQEVIDNKVIRCFLDKNHLQGFVGSKVKIGLYYDDELVSLMTFGKLRNNMNSVSQGNQYELLRFCNKLNTTVIGGASKLFKYFIRNYTYDDIISYADRNHSNGNIYRQLGFKHESVTQPNYYYIIDGIKHYRYNYRKDILVKQGYDKNKTEHEIMLERKIYRIYNSGNYKFVY